MTEKLPKDMTDQEYADFLSAEIDRRLENFDAFLAEDIDPELLALAQQIVASRVSESTTTCQETNPKG